MFTSLMTTRRFAPLFLCQFFAAFGDNFLKTALVFVILFQIGGADSEALITLAGATLIAPFFLLSGLGGEQLCDLLADIAPGAGHDRHLILELHRCLPSRPLFYRKHLTLLHK